LRVREAKKHQQKAGFDEKKLAHLRAQNIHAFFESPKEMREAIRNGDITLHVNKNKKGIPHGLPIIPHCVRICAKRDKKRASMVRFTSTKTKPKCLPSTSARPTLST
jgi:hypothetical protein